MMNKEPTDNPNNSKSDNTSTTPEIFEPNVSSNLDTDSPKKKSTNANNENSSWLLIAGIILLAIFLTWFFVFKQESAEPSTSAPDKTLTSPVASLDKKDLIPLPPKEPVEKAVLEPISEKPLEPVKPDIVLPTLDNSDALVKSKLSTLTWRTELLKLLIDEDIIRRLVVFTDNFTQGYISYKHSPLTLPEKKFSMADDLAYVDANGQRLWTLNEAQTNRFKIYVELLRSLDQEALVQAYIDFKPLFEEAYKELGYEGEFDEVLKEAIEIVLDMDIPNEPLTIARPSVMYKYENEKIESLSDVDKLLLRLGKENLLVVKSVLLDLNEALALKR